MKKLLLFCVVIAGVNIFYSCVHNKRGTAVIEKNIYGKLPDGREVYQYAMTNKIGSTVKVITYGAIVTSLTVPDRHGKFEDVVSGYDSLQGYINDRSSFGAIVGRYGNRIGKGQFILEGNKYQLTGMMVKIIFTGEKLDLIRCSGAHKKYMIAPARLFD